MKLVVDTNVVVSAALNTGRARRILLFIADRPDLEWLVSEEILKEYRDVLARSKFGFPPSVLQQWGISWPERRAW